MSRGALCSTVRRQGASSVALLDGLWSTRQASSQQALRLSACLPKARCSQTSNFPTRNKSCRPLPETYRAYWTEAHNSHGSKSEEAEPERQPSPAASTGKFIVISAILALSSVLAATFIVDSLGRLLDDTDLAAFIVRMRRGKPMNEKSFVPFVIAAKDQISSTSFIITVRPQSSHGTAVEHRDRPQIHDSHSNKAILRKCWDHGLWSVEIKQPQLQIARNYTPLPPRRGDEDEELDSGALRFLIRRYDGGEVSTYLSRLSVGDQVELRGPHLGFEVKKRLGDARRLVFLAGGTGIAPALQTIHILHGNNYMDSDNAAHSRSAPVVSILWANRRREDCAGSADLSSSNNPIVRQLLDMRQQAGNLVDIKCLVDEERTYIGANDIAKSIVVDQILPLNTAAACCYHSGRAIETCAEGDPATLEDCPCQLLNQPGSVGKNIVMVSGPDGFIQHYAGPKIWAGGQELQGPVSGVVGQLIRRYQAKWKDWIILKL